MYVYVCVCVCVCMQKFGIFSLIDCVQYLLRVEMAGGLQANVQGWDAGGLYQRWETVGKHAMQVCRRTHSVREHIL